MLFQLLPAAGYLVGFSLSLYTVIHNYGNPYEKWNIFVARPHLWLQLGMVKPEIMLCEMVPDIRQLSDFYMFQQDSAPAHRARETVELLTMKTPEFIPPTLWPPNSPDLNPVNYKVWSVMQEKVYKKRIKDIVELRARILTAWDEMDQCIIDAAIRQWCTRLRACIKAKGGHFEHTLSQ